MSEIINRVEKSGLISIDLEEILGDIEVVEYDLSQNLFQGLVLREKDFRKEIKEYDWTVFTKKNVCVTCSADAIVPLWAYMLVVKMLQPLAANVIVGSSDELKGKLIDAVFRTVDLSQYNESKVVIKGCSNKNIPIYAYGEVMRLLMPIASSIMFGEPCSTVPLHKKKAVER